MMKADSPRPQVSGDPAGSPPWQQRRVVRRVAWLVVAAVVAAAMAVGVQRFRADAHSALAFRSELQRFVDTQQLSGAVVVIGHSTGTPEITSVGLRRRAPAEPMGADTLFRIASMTKPITAMAVMLLAEDGVLGVDDRVGKYLPEFRSSAVTLRHLLTHTSGMVSGLPGFVRKSYAERDRTLAEVVSEYAQRPLEFAPGSRWAYSNTGIDTLGRVVEVAAAMPFETFLQRRIFDVVGMRDTTFYPTAAQRTRLAEVYQRAGDGLVLSTNPLIGLPDQPKNPIPAGGLCSTAADLAKLYQAMLTRGRAGSTRVLSEASIDTMSSPQTPAGLPGLMRGTRFGFGWAVVQEPRGTSAGLSPGSYGHGGIFGTEVWIDPPRDVFFVMLVQLKGLPGGEAEELRAVVQDYALSRARAAESEKRTDRMREGATVLEMSADKGGVLCCRD